jgi:hypothetical protein
VSIVYSRADAVVAHAGQRIRLLPGEPWDAADPLVKAHPDLFVDRPSHVRTSGGYRPVEPERAVTGPAERRTKGAARAR